MSLNELRRYVLNHRDDQEAWNEYVLRNRPNAVVYPATDNPQEIENSLKEFLDSNFNS
ncbi:MAG: hypothetical protein AAFQ80_20865 [Cyanobacteria bacterium J06621_8]